MRKGNFLLFMAYTLLPGSCLPYSLMSYWRIWGKKRVRVSPLSEEDGPPLLPMEAKASTLDVTVPSTTSITSDHSTHL